MLDLDPHPLDAAPATHRLALLRVLCTAMTFGLVLVTILIVMVVWFALDGQPIAGNSIRFAGFSALTWAAVLSAVAAPVVALLVSAAIMRAGLAKLRPDADADKLLDVFAAGMFAEYGIAETAGTTCALCYHLTADAPLLVAVGGLAVFMLMRLPSTDRVRRWYDVAKESEG